MRVAGECPLHKSTLRLSLSFCYFDILRLVCAARECCNKCCNSNRCNNCCNSDCCNSCSVFSAKSTLRLSLSCFVNFDILCQFPLKMLHSRNPQNSEIHILRYKFKSNQNLDLNLYRKIPRNLSFSISVVLHCFHEHVHFFWKDTRAVRAVCTTSTMGWLRFVGSFKL